MAWARMIEHRFGEALELAFIADSLAPDDPRTQALMSDALMELGRYDQAVEAVERLLSLKPGAMAWIRTARLRFLHDDLEGPIELMVKAAKNVSREGEHSAWIWLKLAKLHLFHRDTRAAARSIARAQRAYPGLPAIVRMRARLALALGKPRTALAFYRKAVNLRPKAEDVLTAWRLSRQLDEPGQVKHWSALLEGMASLEGYRLSQRALAEYFAATGRYDRARTLALGALAVRPDIYSHAVMARVLARAGDDLQAKEHARAALRLNTPDPRLQAQMGAILADKQVTIAQGAIP